MNTNMTTGAKIRALRERAGLSQVQIANFLQIDQSAISKYEKGDRKFSVDMLERLCALFGCALEDLLKADDVSTFPTFGITFRSTGIQSEDLAAIADINRIALNLRWMQNLLDEEG